MTEIAPYRLKAKTREAFPTLFTHFNINIYEVWIPLHNTHTIFLLWRSEHEKLEKHKFQELRITVWPGAT